MEQVLYVGAAPNPPFLSLRPSAFSAPLRLSFQACDTESVKTKLKIYRKSAENAEGRRVFII